MTFQLVRSKQGKLRGLAILFGNGHVEAGRDQTQPWRLCDLCIENHAIVFCMADTCYVCDKCLAWHTFPGHCRYLSVSAAREVATAALKESA